MGVEMVIDENNNYSIYMITASKPISTKQILKIVILILLVFILIGLLMIAKNSISMIREYKIYEQYETQLAVLQKQERERQAKLEKRKQEKMPKLTQERKKQYGKYLSFRNQKSILDF